MTSFTELNWQCQKKLVSCSSLFTIQPSHLFSDHQRYCQTLWFSNNPDSFLFTTWGKQMYSLETSAEKHIPKPGHVLLSTFLIACFSCLALYGFHGKVLVVEWGSRDPSMTSCWKLLPCVTEPVLASSQMDLLAKVIRDTLVVPVG